MLPALILTPGCATQTITATEVCGIVAIVKLSQKDTTETQKQVVMNNAALRAAGCA